PDCILGEALILRPPTSGTSRGLCPHSLGSTGGRHGDEDGPRAVRTAGRGLHRIAGVRGAGSGLRGLRRLHRERGARPSEVAAARGLPVRARASRAARDLLGNLLEELGLEAESERPHPALLEDLLRAAGLGHRLVEVEARAADDVRRIVTEPLLYSALREVGLAALTEIVAFEFMLSRVSGRMARALATHRGLAAPALEWFTHHSEVDVRHAEQGLADLGAYAAYYEFTDDEALTIVEMTLRENVFTRRYFRDATAAGTPR